MTRLSRPLDEKAVRAADSDFYAKHPELIKDGKRIPLSKDQADLQKEWRDLYIKHGGKIEPPKQLSDKKPKDVVQTCSEGCASAPLDKSKNPDQRKQFGNDLKGAFPNLGETYEVLAPAANNYNCIAHTLGVNDEWVDPKTGSKENPLSEMDKMYEKIGYTRTKSLDTSFDTTKKKIVVYATKNPDGSIKEITHGAIQDNNGTFESKLGDGPLIRHTTPEALNGAAYGEPVAVYTK